VLLLYEMAYLLFLDMPGRILRTTSRAGNGMRRSTYITYYYKKAVQPTRTTYFFSSSVFVST